MSSPRKVTQYGDYVLYEDSGHATMQYLIMDVTGKVICRVSVKQYAKLLMLTLQTMDDKWREGGECSRK